MAVIKSEHTSFTSLGEALVSAGFATNYWVGSNKNLRLALTNHIYQALQLFVYDAEYPNYLGAEYGSINISTGVFTTNHALRTASLIRTGTLNLTLYSDALNNWFAVYLADSIVITPWESFFYHGKLSTGQAYSFICSNSVNGFKSGSTTFKGGEIIYSQDNRISAHILGFGQLAKIDNHLAMCDLLVRKYDTAEIVMNGDMPAHIVGLKWLFGGAQRTEFGDSFVPRYVRSGIDLIGGSIFIPFG